MCSKKAARGSGFAVTLPADGRATRGCVEPSPDIFTEEYKMWRHGDALTAARGALISISWMLFTLAHIRTAAELQNQ